MQRVHRVINKAQRFVGSTPSVPASFVHSYSQSREFRPCYTTQTRTIQTKYNTVPGFSQNDSSSNNTHFISKHAQLDKTEISRYLDRKNLAYKELPDKFIVCECPLCTKPTYGKSDNMWKLCIYNSGAYHCLRCGSKGSFYGFKERLGDLPKISSVPGVADEPVAQLNQDDAKKWVAQLESTPAVLNYLTQERGLNLATLKAYHVGAHQLSFPSASKQPGAEWAPHDCIVFPWAVPLLVTGGDDVFYQRAKVRSVESKSCMRLLPRGGEWGFFGWHLVPHDATEIIITEGEFDAMAVYQATGRPAVSLPNGCRSLPPQLLPCLERFTKVILWTDDDAAGHEGAEAMIQKLGPSRCVLVQGGLGAKDANEALIKGLDLNTMLASAAAMSHKQIVSFSQFRNDVKRMFTDPNAHVGVQLANMPHLQSLMKGHRRGEFTIFTGPTGMGKTTILSQLSLEVAQQGVPTLWGSFEIRNPRLARTMMKQYAPLLGVELNERNPAAFDYVADKFQELPLHFLKFYGSSPVQEVIEAMEYAVYVHDVQHIVLDNLQFMLSGQGRHNSDKFDLQDRAIEAFRQFASQRNVHISIVIHPRKEADNSSLGLASVFGSGKATQEADNVLIVQGGLPKTLTKSLGIEGKNNKAGNKPDMSQGGGFDDPITGEIMATFFRTLELRKNRWDGDLGAVPLRFDKNSARLYELTPEDAQTGLVDFVEKHRKLKQMDLLKHMSSHTPERSTAFDGMPVAKSTAYVSRPPQQGPPVSQREWTAVPDGQMKAAIGNVFPAMDQQKMTPDQRNIMEAEIVETLSTDGQEEVPRKPRQLVPPRMHQPSLDIIID